MPTNDNIQNKATKLAIELWNSNLDSYINPDEYFIQGGIMN